MAIWTQSQQLSFIKDRIYWRMHALHYCRTITDLVDRHGYNQKASSTIADAESLVFDSFQEMAYPVIDIGIMNCRVLLQFLGIYYVSMKPIGKFEIVETKFASDVTIKRFGLPLVSLTAKGWPPNLNAEQAKSLLHTLRAANKGIGHLTRNRARELSLADLGIACQAVIQLINEQLCRPAGRAPVTFSSPARIQTSSHS